MAGIQPTATTLPTLTISVDPGATSGWAVFVDGKLHAHGMVKEVTPRLAYNVVRFYQKLFPEPERKKRMVLEDQFLFAPKPGDEETAKDAVQGVANRFRSIVKVVQVRAWWEAAGDLLGFERLLFVSQSWQGPTGVVTLAKLKFGGDRKKASQWICGETYGGSFGKDEADATLLGRWAEIERTTGRLGQQLNLGALLEQEGVKKPRRRR